MLMPSSGVCARSMASGRARDYRLSRCAIADLDDIWKSSAETWSIEQADHLVDELVRLFDTIASMPALARERPEFSFPVRIHNPKSHLIAYQIAEDHIIDPAPLGRPAGL